MPCPRRKCTRRNCVSRLIRFWRRNARGAIRCGPWSPHWCLQDYNRPGNATSVTCGRAPRRNRAPRRRTLEGTQLGPHPGRLRVRVACWRCMELSQVDSELRENAATIKKLTERLDLLNDERLAAAEVRITTGSSCLPEFSTFMQGGKTWTALKR